MSRRSPEGAEELKRKVKVGNRYGMHARPAAMIVETAKRFESDIMILSGDNQVSAKSIMGLLTLAAGHGAMLTLLADGPDAHEALEAIQALFDKKFDED